MTRLGLSALAWIACTLFPVVAAAAPPQGEAIERYLQSTRQRLCPDGADAPSTEEATRLVFEARDLLSYGDVDGVKSRLCRVLARRILDGGLTAPRTLGVFNNYATVLRTEGRAAEARDLLEHLMPAAAGETPERRFLSRSLLHNLGTALYAQGYMREAERADRGALALGGGETLGPEGGPTLTNLAFALEAQGRYVDAEAEHRRALDLRRAPGVHMPLEAAASLNNLGANLTAQGRLREAEPMLREALATREVLAGPDSLNTGFSLSALANNLLLQGRAKEALTYAEALVRLRRGALGDLHPETAASFQLLATVCLAAGDPARALDYARLALAARVPQTLREEAALSESARSTLRRTPGATALTLVRAAWEASSDQPRAWRSGEAPPMAAEAFVAAQRIPASSTADALARAAGRRAAEGEGQGELARRLETQLIARAALDQASAETARPGGPAAALQARRAQANADVAATEAELRRRYPEFFDYLRPEPVALQGLTAGGGPLHEDEVLVVMTPGAGRDRGLVWAVTRDGGAWAEIPLDPGDLERKIVRFRRLLDLTAGRRTDAAAPREAVEDFDWDDAQALYDALFTAPQIAALVKSKPRWILAPQGMLLSVPFAPLVAAPPLAGRVGPTALRSAAWLGLDRVLSLTPSVSSLKTLRDRAAAGRTADRPFFGVGNPAFAGAAAAPRDAAAYFGGRLADAAQVRTLAPLPGTALEISELARALGASRTDYLLGAEATESEVKLRSAAGVLAHARVVAFATHGLVSGDLRNTLAEPALALTPPAVSDEEDDGLLTASEAAELRLNADWVLLSACNTAAGDRPNGEGLSGLARAFLLAGARSLIASHWRVPDDVAGRLTTRAMRLATDRGGRDRAGALQTAMREVLADRSRDRTSAPFAHPAFWAAFAYIGLD